MPSVTPLAGPIEFGLPEVEEVLQNVAVILATPEGTQPLDRPLGVPGLPLDDPRPAAAQQLKVDIAEEVERREPRATVDRVSFSAGDPPTGGKLVPQVHLTIDLNAAE